MILLLMPRKTGCENQSLACSWYSDTLLHVLSRTILAKVECAVTFCLVLHAIYMVVFTSVVQSFVQPIRENMSEVTQLEERQGWIGCGFR